MDAFLIILGIICLLVGLAGCFLPVLPGPPIAYVALLLLHFTQRVDFTVTQLVVWFLLVVAVQLLDYFTPILGSRYAGGSRWGVWGCMIGMFAGIFFFPPWGIVVGPFAGAVLGELLGGKQWHAALKTGWGTFLGFLVSVVVKVSLCGYFIYRFIRALV